MGTIFIAGNLPELSDSQKKISKAAWKRRDRHAKVRKASAAIVIYRSPEYQRECEIREAEAAAGKLARKLAGIEKRKATMAAKRARKFKA